ncbi:uncharacterized protein Tco025E_03530 [Trypanosoma conorhini]|uniref:Uncharacterized protein n=1 Tax=Trypanosoma conorhini TaxID=83891 RepID=A0A3R7S4B9_9TRYP|nr:uncharacterized protein Tco025E_03530 [Trypanosoma conorhini]RNF21077.1 hypothetical protein Tco025E_03530 [Trypanosoma conorhini]
MEWIWQNASPPVAPPPCRTWAVQPPCVPPVGFGAACEEALMSANVADGAGGRLWSSTAIANAEEDEEEDEEEGRGSSDPVMYISPAVAEAARRSSRELFHSLLRGSNSAQALGTPPPQPGPPLAITWHRPTTASPLSSVALSAFKPLPHTKRTREAAGFSEPPADGGTEARAFGVRGRGALGPLPPAAKRWRVEGDAQLAARHNTEPATSLQRAFRRLSARKRPREEEEEEGLGAPDAAHERCVEGAKSVQ